MSEGRERKTVWKEGKGENVGKEEGKALRV